MVAMLEGIGRINTYAAMQQLQKNIRSKQKQGCLPADAGGSEPKTMLVQADTSSEHEWRMLTIVSRIGSGGRLSAVDLEYLRQKAPELYEKALNVAKSREEFEQNLKRSKTKAEASRLHMEAGQTAAFSLRLSKNAEANSAGAAEQAMLNQAFESSWSDFAGSKKYQTLPADERERKAREAKKTARN